MPSKRYYLLLPVVMDAIPYLWQKLKHVVSLICLYTFQVKRNEDDITLETNCPELSPSIDIPMELICHARSKHKIAYFPNKVYFVIICKQYCIKNPLTRWRNVEIIVGSVTRTAVVMIFTLSGFSYLKIVKNLIAIKKFLNKKETPLTTFFNILCLSLKL